MTMMTNKQLQLLGATHGAYSVVTEREATGDRSVTLDVDEKFVLSQKIPLNSIVRRGGAVDNRPERKYFLFFNSPNVLNLPAIDIPIVHPKAAGNEIRLYMQGNRGFFGNQDDVFVIFCRANDAYPTVGFIPSARWEGFWANLNNASEVMSVLASQDTDDSSYQQNLLASQAGVPVQQVRNVFTRDPLIAKAAIEQSNFTCEIDPLHQTFISPVTGRNFMEAHHLIPMSQQTSFHIGLDQPANIVSLCPCCHRAIHLGQSSTRRKLLQSLFNKRENVLQQMGVNFERLCALYGVDS
ncbi:HNH endonuclease [Aeromonas sp. sif2433]|uniref:HNH endonuclease n=1 Tax=Aeromonas sp. sif2433 TaxID=2854794 RepID=UPI001C46F114|nr:HNH endonuclease [Aeromonas sp. sif2433]MBV7413578.1 HNH endonuclease [Aeromonas sp. sif2433]